MSDDDNPIDAALDGLGKNMVAIWVWLSYLMIAGFVLLGIASPLASIGILRW